MKILTIATAKTDVLRRLPKDEQNRLSLETIQHIMEVKKKLGDKLQFYTEVGWGRTVSIGEHASLEEYAWCINTPMAQAGFTNYETYPLTEISEKDFQNYYESLKSAK